MMSDFGNLSDTDDSAVEELISEVQDLCVLEQLSKLNSSSFAETLLPSHLETRLRKLKSFPVPDSKAESNGFNSLKGGQRGGRPVSEQESEVFSADNGECPDRKMDSLKGESEVFLDAKQNPERNLGLEKESLRGRASSPLNSSSSSRDDDEIIKPEKKSASFLNSPSPPHKTCCFWCSPKRASKKRSSKENCSLDWSRTNDEMMLDLGVFSVKEQQKILKKAMKEEEKISREAEKIVKWAKQASARMSFHDIEDDKSDDDDDGKK